MANTQIQTENGKRTKTSVWWLYLTQRAQRTRRTLLSSNNIFIILCALCALCVRKQNIRVVVIISRKERRERGVLIPLLFTLTLEKSQVSLRRENAENTERAEIYGIAYVINVFFIYLYGQSMIMLYEGHR